MLVCISHLKEKNHDGKITRVMQIVNKKISTSGENKYHACSRAYGALRSMETGLAKFELALVMTRRPRNLIYLHRKSKRI